MNYSWGLPHAQIDALSWLYVSCLILSLCGSFSILLASVIKRRHLNEQANPLLQLAVADLLASAALMGTTLINFQSYNTLPHSATVCEKALPLSLMFYCISFLLVIIYACESACTVQGWRETMGEECGEQLQRRRRRKFMLAYFCVWILPLVGYIIYIKTVSLMMMPLDPQCNVDNDKQCSSHTAKFCNSCLLFLHIWKDDCASVEEGHDIFIRGFTFASVLCVLTCCSMVYCRLGSWYRRYEQMGVFPVEGDGLSRRRLQGTCSSSRYMILIILICWAPALLLISLSFTGIQQKQLFPLYVIQALTVSLQGFLNSIVYAWRRRNFREVVLGERLPLLAGRAFFDQSLGEPTVDHSGSTPEGWVGRGL